MSVDNTRRGQRPGSRGEGGSVDLVSQSIGAARITMSLEAEASHAQRWRREFAEEDQETLVRIVKECQSRNFTGKNGSFAEFLRATGRGQGKRTDPSRYAWDVMVEYLKSLTDERSILAIRRHQRYAEDLNRCRCGSSDPISSSAYPKSGVWELVGRTEHHPSFRAKYDFPSYSKGWRRVWNIDGPFDERPQLVSLDCEMCETKKSKKDLLAVSLVDEKGNILYSTLVKPKSKVLDYRSDVTGIKEDDLKDVHVTRAQASRELRQFLNRGVVLVGHSLNHDLRALRLDYRPVVDTSLLYRFKGLEMALPSLEILSSRILGRQLRSDKIHSSIDDAKVTMELVMQELGRGGIPHPPLSAPEIKVGKEDLKRLLIHSLPNNIRLQELHALFRNGHGPTPVKFEGHRRSSAFAIFKSIEDANIAYKRLPGVAGTDLCGRPQKRKVCLVFSPEVGRKGSVEVVVRKMAAHNGMMYGKDMTEKKRKRTRG